MAVTRLFRIIMDVTSPRFNVEGRQWRPNVVDIFYHYFTCMWADSRVSRNSLRHAGAHINWT
jgi:hypothetical protein